MTDFDDISYYLEIEVDYILENKIILCQNTYLKKIFNCFDMIDWKPISLPIKLGVANSLQPFDKTADP